MAETGLKLRTGCPNGDWRSFPTTAGSGGVTRGQMCQIHDTVGVYAQDADAGADVAFIYHAEKIVVPKLTVSGTDIFNPGDKVYYSVADAKVTADHGSNLWIGIALEAALAADTEIKIDLLGNKAD